MKHGKRCIGPSSVSHHHRCCHPQKCPLPALSSYQTGTVLPDAQATWGDHTNHKQSSLLHTMTTTTHLAHAQPISPSNHASMCLRQYTVAVSKLASDHWHTWCFYCTRWQPLPMAHAQPISPSDHVSMHPRQYTICQAVISLTAYCAISEQAVSDRAAPVRGSQVPWSSAGSCRLD